MFHKIKNVSAIPDCKLSIHFARVLQRFMNVKPLFEQLPVFTALQNEKNFPV